MDDRTLDAGELDRLRRTDLTYPEVGGTTHAELPAGYHHVHRRVMIGSGPDRFAAASRFLLGWGMHRGSGVRVRSSTDTIETGTVAVLTVGVGWASVRAPVRVVYVLDGPERQGFAYGTLPGHPETGEELFAVELQADGAVMLTITAFSRAANRLSRLAGPLRLAVQSWVTDRYVLAMQV
jgi:uncharacterized protein (UPF0548 family)